MKTNLKTTGSVLRRSLLPTTRGFEGGLCPQAGFRRVGDTAEFRVVEHDQALIPTGDAGMAAGPRTWRPIT